MVYFWFIGEGRLFCLCPCPSSNVTHGWRLQRNEDLRVRFSAKSLMFFTKTYTCLKHSQYFLVLKKDNAYVRPLMTVNRSVGETLCGKNNRCFSKSRSLPGSLQRLGKMATKQHDDDHGKPDSGPVRVWDIFTYTLVTNQSNRILWDHYQRPWCLSSQYQHNCGTHEDTMSLFGVKTGHHFKRCCFLMWSNWCYWNVQQQ